MIKILSRLTFYMLGLLVLPVQAQAPAATELRDPTQPPASLRAAASAASGAAEADALLPQQILMQGGKAWLVVQGRRLGVGALWGEARILAIDERGVTVSEAGVKRRVPLFSGVEKKAPAAERASAPAAARARKQNPSEPS